MTETAGSGGLSVLVSATQQTSSLARPQKRSQSDRTPELKNTRVVNMDQREEYPTAGKEGSRSSFSFHISRAGGVPDEYGTSKLSRGRTSDRSERKWSGDRGFGGEEELDYPVGRAWWWDMRGRTGTATSQPPQQQRGKEEQGGINQATTD